MPPSLLDRIDASATAAGTQVRDQRKFNVSRGRDYLVAGVIVIVICSFFQFMCAACRRKPRDGSRLKVGGTLVLFGGARRLDGAGSGGRGAERDTGPGRLR